jgi:DNA-binding CsgD family transcriptional regulator
MIAGEGFGQALTKAMRGRPGSFGLHRDRLIRPYGMAGSPWEGVTAGLCIALLGAILVAELLTPYVVVGTFAVIPLLAGLWMLSSRVATLVAIAATLFLGAAVAIETANRMNVILIGVAVFVTAVIARVYATALASVLSSRRRIRPVVKSWITPATLDGIERSSHAVRSLTRRELQVARLGAEGYTAAEIGRRLNIGVRTVESHLASAYSKLRISSRVQLVRMASQLGGPP